MNQEGNGITAVKKAYVRIAVKLVLADLSFYDDKRFSAMSNLPVEALSTGTAISQSHVYTFIYRSVAHQVLL